MNDKFLRRIHLENNSDFVRIVWNVLAFALVDLFRIIYHGVEENQIRGEEVNSCLS